jgi:3-phosphoshikimate 1-carboxyvinyltransferase
LLEPSGDQASTEAADPDLRPIEPLERPPDVEIDVPGSKSHTNRALLCAALAPGRSRLNRVLFANDTEAMLAAVGSLVSAVRIDRDRAEVEVDGGIAGPAADPPAGRLAVHAAQSGTTGRFLLPVLAATPGHFTLDGDPQLRGRPFGPQLEALRSLGAQVEGESLPLTVDGRRLRGGTVAVDGAISSQFISGLLLAAPLFSDTTTVAVNGTLISRPYVDLTLSTMAAFGVEVAVAGPAEGAETDAFIVPSQPYRPAEVELEPDASAASYFFAAAAMTGGRVRVRGLGRTTVQGDLAFVDILARMGAQVDVGPDWTEVRGVGTLRGVEVDMADVSDTAQTLAVVAAMADGPTTITGIGFIRHKETDRIAAPVTELQRLGIDAVANGDGMTIHPGSPRPGTVHTYDDHRMAMSFALLGLCHPGIVIADPGCVTKTFPTYFDHLERLRRAG